MCYNCSIAQLGVIESLEVKPMKTFLPQLLKIGRRLCGYIRRYEDKIKQTLPEEKWPLLDAVLVACDALEVAILLLLPPDV
jgi:hypothetical protein